MVSLCIYLMTQGLAGAAHAQQTISFDEPEFDGVSTIDGVEIDSINGTPIVGLRFGFLIDGQPSDAAMIRSGPGDSAFVQEPGIEGPTAGELRLDFSGDVLQVIFGVSLSRRQAQPEAIRIRTFDEAGRFISESFFSTSAIQGAFSGAWVSVASSNGFRTMSVTFESLASRFFLDNIFVARAFSTPETRQISEQASHSTLLKGPDGHLTFAWTEHATNGDSSLRLADFDDDENVAEIVSWRPRPSLLTPAVTKTADGFLIGWSSTLPTPGIPDSGGPVILGQVLGFPRDEGSQSGSPGETSSREFVVAQASPAALAIARAATDENWFLWSEGRTLSSRFHLEAVGASSETFTLALTSPAETIDLVSANDGSSVVAVWEERNVVTEPASSAVFAALLDRNGFDEASIVRIDESGGGREASVVAHPDGGFVAAWLEEDILGSPSIRVRSLGPRLDAAGPSFRVSPARTRRAASPRIAVNTLGDLAVVWTQQAADLPTSERAVQSFRNLAGRLSTSSLLGGAWTELQIPTQALLGADPVAPAIQLDDSGRLAISWEADDTTEPSALMATTLELETPNCGSRSTLCLARGRFEAEVTWSDFDGRTGSGKPQGLSDDTGVFWFFDAASTDLVVKVLDGRSINGHFWVYYGSLTNVAFELTVTDTATGERRTYSNPDGHFASIGDTEAFSSELLVSGSRVAPLHAEWLAPRPTIAPKSQELAACEASRLCLGPRDRFEVSVTWSGFDGATGNGYGESWSESSGYFWFFDEANVELFVKILDGREINGHHWVFFASLSNVAFELTVTDRSTGAVATYTNPSGRFASNGDTRALPSS